MKTNLLVLIGLAFLASITSSPAQTVTPIVVTAPALARPVQFVSVPLDAAHASALLAAYAAQPQTQAGLIAAVPTVATLPSGYTLVSARFDLSGAGGFLSLSIKSGSPVTSQ